MEKQVMTRAQLAELIEEHVKGVLGSEMATMIRENVEKAVAPLQQRMTDWGARITDRAPERRETPLAEKGISLARCVRAVAAAKLAGSGPDGAISNLKLWGYGYEAEEWQAFRGKSMQAGDATQGGFLVPVQFVNDFIAVLRSATVIRKLGTPTIPMPTGTAKIGKGTAGATAGYVGEVTNAPKTQMSTGQLTLSFKKLMALVPVSNDLLRYSSPGADMIVRNDLVAAMAVKEDSAFIRGDGTDGSPRGLRYWAPGANLVAANGTVSNQNTATDLGLLMQALMGNDIPMITPGWVLAPRVKNFLMTLQNANGVFVYKDEMAGGTLWGYPFGVTTGVPTNLGSGSDSEIYFVDFAQGLIGEAESMSVDASQEAAYHDGSQVQSAWSRDETTVRAIAEHDFIMRYDKAVAVLTGVTWAPGSV